jgi:hypothetical protein
MKLPLVPVSIYSLLPPVNEEAEAKYTSTVKLINP